MLQPRQLHGFLRIPLLICLTFSVDFGVGLPYRLNKDVTPDSYDIWLKPYVEPKDGAKENTFDGLVNITLHTMKDEVNVLILHKKLIEIKEITLYEEASDRVVISNAGWSFEEPTDRLFIHLNQLLKAHQTYKLKIIYTGRIRHERAGVFRAAYPDINKKLKTILLTQSNQIEARSIVPCFDEPSFKAKFRLRISRPRQFQSLFNTQLLYSAIEDNATQRYLDGFDWTPKMSSYLLAFMLCDYTKTPHDNNLIFYTRPEFLTWTTFSQSVAPIVLSAFNDYTKQSYELLGNKIFQQASAPSFPYTSMENWGLVLYDDKILVHEPGYTDGWYDKQRTLTAITHATAQMWFGNSVTFAWWSCFWLKAGFGNYYQYFMAHKLYPAYQLDQQFVLEQVQTALDIDAMDETQPLTSREEMIESPADIAGKFQRISYVKGAAVLRMFQNLMGQLSFDAAVRDYLQAFYLKNVIPNDLFLQLQHHWPPDQAVDLNAFFKDWTEKAGYPVLYVDDTDKSLEIVLRQQRFLRNKNDGSDQSLRYIIPITYTTNNEKDFENLEPMVYFNDSINFLTIHLKQPIKWCIFNIKQSNYYRVFYSTKLLFDIQKALMEPQYGGIHVTNRAQIIDDLFNFASASLMDYRTVFDFGKYLALEIEYAPWQAAFKGLQYVSKRLTLRQQKQFGDLILNLSHKVYQKLGFESNNDSVLDVYSRNDVVYWNCKYGNSECNRKAQALLKFYNLSNTKPNPDFRHTLYCSAVRFGNFSSYCIVYDWYFQENRDSEKEMLLRALGCTLYFAEFHFSRIFKNEFPPHHTALVLRSLYAENPENVSPIFNAIVARYVLLKERLGGWSQLAEVIADIADFFTTMEQLYELEDFIATHGYEFGSDVKTLQNAARNVEFNINWAEESFKNFYFYTTPQSNASMHSLTLILLSLSFILICLN